MTQLLRVTALVSALGFSALALGHGNNPPLMDTQTWLKYVQSPWHQILMQTAPEYRDVFSVATECAELAIITCGSGKVCCMCVSSSNGDVSCAFGCQDAEGNCQPCPECNPGTSEN